MTSPAELPVVYISHGSPMVAVEKDDYTRALGRMGESLPLPRAIVVVSAHWEAPAPVRVGLAAMPETIHDFGGFPEELYRLRYPCPGEPKLAAEIQALLAEAGIVSVGDERRGLDHGAWVPLLHAYPGAEIPVLEVTLPQPRSPAALLALGQALGPLRKQGVLLIGSGGIVHNLRRVHFGDKNAPVDPWAKAFDDWVRSRLESGDVASIADYQAQAPESGRSVPTTEHFDPLFVVLGAAGKGGRIVDLYEGFHYGNLSMRTFALTEAPSPKR
jgi:4,5-DOPA dioxygenase extradiol